MNDAQTLAIDILNWLASEPDLFNRFVGLSGIEISDLRSAANEPGFFVGVISFLIDHEPTLLAYCEAHKTAPESVIEAYRVLGGEIHI